LKYSDYFIDSLVKLGYTHCFFVNGGNVMHLIESARTRMKCIAVVNEVSAGIAAEYFNVTNRENNRRAIVIVTAGPGITNVVTAVAGAWLESRELLIIGGQARTEFLSRGTVRQMGHQEIDGVSILSSITNKSVRVETPLKFAEIAKLADISKNGRKGPVFMEMCLDVTATEINFELPSNIQSNNSTAKSNTFRKEVKNLSDLISKSSRPMFLIGGGLDYKVFKKSLPTLRKLGIPIATTWNTVDYLDYDDELFAGRPNTYGMRWSNIAIQQSDLLISVGARLGLQQTGFAWDEFVPNGKVVQVDIDKFELNKANPGIDLKVLADAGDFLNEFVLNYEIDSEVSFTPWLSFISEVKNSLPIVDPGNQLFDGYANPFKVVYELGTLLNSNDQVTCCSSGGSYTSMMQAFPQKTGQLLTNNKALASMGYGLAGAIGTALAFPEKRTILVEGDGGFAQNLSEIGTVSNNKLNLKMFIFSNGGYASIRISQKAYFDGKYIGCDVTSGLELPNWAEIFDAYGIPSVEISDLITSSGKALDLLNAPGPAAFIVKIHEDQPFLPKVTSTLSSNGSMKSNPIHLMNPPLNSELQSKLFKYI